MATKGHTTTLTEPHTQKEQPELSKGKHTQTFL